MKRESVNKRLLKKTSSVAVFGLLLLTAIIMPITRPVVAQQTSADELTFSEIKNILTKSLPIYEDTIDEIIQYVEQYSCVIG